jgi:hypothetical protein
MGSVIVISTLSSARCFLVPAKLHAGAPLRRCLFNSFVKRFFFASQSSRCASHWEGESVGRWAATPSQARPRPCHHGPRAAVRPASVVRRVGEGQEVQGCEEDLSAAHAFSTATSWAVGPSTYAKAAAAPAAKPAITLCTSLEAPQHVGGQTT